MSKPRPAIVTARRHPRPTIVTARPCLPVFYPIVPHSTMRHVPAIRDAALSVAEFSTFVIRHACPSNYAGLLDRIRALDKACAALQEPALKSR